MFDGEVKSCSIRTGLTAGDNFGHHGALWGFNWHVRMSQSLKNKSLIAGFSLATILQVCSTVSNRMSAFPDINSL